MNLELAYNILDILGTMQDGVKQMRAYFMDRNMQDFSTLGMDIWDGLFTLQQIAQQEIPTGSRIRLADGCTCALESLKDIKKFAITSPEKVVSKLESELAPILKTISIQFYYWALVQNNFAAKTDFQNYLHQISINSYIQEAESNGIYKYDLTIVLLAYNHLDYTQVCLDSILHNLPEDISIELLLVNHGSSDGTKEYFEGINAAKVLNIAINGALPGVRHGAYQGRYILNISNDTLITENAIRNLYDYIRKHKECGWAVPTTPNVSNAQNIPAEYKDVEGLQEFARKNNIYDERKHEQRVRLCNPIDIMRGAVEIKVQEDLYIELHCTDNQWLCFPDDKISLWMRRNGYKQILLKDAYCHHCGSITIKNETERHEEMIAIYTNSRQEFFSSFGVDPYGPGFCYDYYLFEEFELPVVNDAHILGINCGLGSNPLKIGECLKEIGATGSTIYNCVQDQRYLDDLKGVSDYVYLITDLTDIVSATGRSEFEFIIIEEGVRGCEQNNIFEALKQAGLSFRVLIYREDKVWIVRDGEEIKKIDVR